MVCAVLPYPHRGRLVVGLATAVVAAACGSAAAPGAGGAGGAPTIASSGGSGGRGGAGGDAIAFDAGLGGAPSCDAAPPWKDAGAACDPGDAGHYAADVVPILVTCTGEVCHGQPTRGSLRGVLASECCDGTLLVDPGHPERSYLVEKLRGAPHCGGSKMPPGGAVSEDAIARVEAWICRGAPDD
jgi:hypothetical protein